MRLRDLLGVSLEELKTLLAAEARAEVRAQLAREDVDPDRRRELLGEALGISTASWSSFATAPGSWRGWRTS